MSYSTTGSRQAESGTIRCFCFYAAVDDACSIPALNAASPQSESQSTYFGISCICAVKLYVNLQSLSSTRSREQILADRADSARESICWLGLLTSLARTSTLLVTRQQYRKKHLSLHVFASYCRSSRILVGVDLLYLHGSGCPHTAAPQVYGICTPTLDFT